MELSVEEYNKIFSNSSDVLDRLNHVSLTGGEPLLRTDLAEILKAIVKYFPDASINVNTNGFSTPALMRFVEDSVKVTNNLKIMLSLDGLGEAHDIVRGVPGAFQKTFASIEELLKFKNANRGKIKIAINHVLTRHNYMEFEKIHEYCKKNKLDLTPIIIQHGQFFDNLDLDVSLDEKSRGYLLEKFKDIVKKEGKISLLNLEIIEQLSGKERDYSCWAGKIMLLIEDDGKVYPNGGCNSDWFFGNVREHHYSLKSVLETKKAEDIFSRIKQCRACRFACETLTTLREPEALAGYRKLKDYAARKDN